jgi:hypothetical protein
MKTEDLIEFLATGIEPIADRGRSRRLAVVQGAGIIVAVLLSVIVLKVNPHLGLETREPAFWIRAGFCLAIGVTALFAVYRLGLPGRRLGRLPIIIAVAAAVVWILAIGSLIEAPPASRLPMIMGHTARACPFLIAFLAVGPLAGFIWSLRALAPTRLHWAGAAAGLASGGFGAAAYTLHCPELEPAFFGLWYVLGMLIPTFLGAWLGPRLLRW